MYDTHDTRHVIFNKIGDKKEMCDFLPYKLQTQGFATLDLLNYKLTFVKYY